MSEPVLDAAESHSDFSEWGQSSKDGFLGTRLESRISIIGRYSSLPCV